MTYKERIISTIKGESTDELPFIPRLDLWYKANKFCNTLPKRYKNATLREITDDLGIGYHAVVPDFRNFETENDNVGFALGMVNLKTNSYEIDFSGIEYRINETNGLTTVEFFTPPGKITTKVLYNENMRRAGITIPHIIEHAIKSLDDYEAIAYIFENVGVKKAYKNYIKHQEFVGDRGVAVAFNLLSASPMHLIVKELMTFELFVYELNDNKERLEWLANKINIFFDKIFEIVSSSPAEIIFSGANYDSFLTWPPFFKRYITPYLLKQSERAHYAGKFLLTHTDGENRGLLEEYLDSEIDVADSICPNPMTSLTLKEVRNVFGSRITIWGGLPSICVLEDSMSDYEFEKYINEILENIGSGDNLILSFADTTPPAAKFERIKRVAGLVRKFGPVNISR
jgi:hypothetical protein